MGWEAKTIHLQKLCSSLQLDLYDPLRETIRTSVLYYRKQKLVELLTISYLQECFVCPLEHFEMILFSCQQF